MPPEEYMIRLSASLDMMRRMELVGIPTCDTNCSAYRSHLRRAPFIFSIRPIQATQGNAISILRCLALPDIAALESPNLVHWKSRIYYIETGEFHGIILPNITE